MESVTRHRIHRNRTEHTSQHWRKKKAAQHHQNPKNRPQNEKVKNSKSVTSIPAPTLAVRRREVSARKIVPKSHEGPLPLSELMPQIQDLKLERAGVIPYTMIGRTIYFCLGVDKATGDLTDFGGRFSTKKDRHSLDTAIRELKEESQMIFSVNMDQIGKGWYVKSERDMVLFLRCEPGVALSSGSLFRQKVREAQRPEVKAIVWLTSTEMMLELASSSFYFRVKNLILPSIESIVDLLSYESYLKIYNNVGQVRDQNHI